MADILLLNQVNLVIQIVVFVLFMTSIALKMKGRTMLHGWTMVGAYALNMASLLLIMTPLFLTGLPIVTENPDEYSTLFLWHHIFGLIAVILSTFLVLRFAWGRFSAKYCRGLLLMRATAVFWSISLLMGLYLYYVGYFPG